jgi:hypothetical protein
MFRACAAGWPAVLLSPTQPAGSPMGGAESVPTREDVLVYTSARAAAAVEALTTNRRSRQQPDINSLDEATLRFILLSATTHDDLLEHIATCACVCPEWWQIVICSPAYGGGWAPDVAGQTLRRQVLQTISHRLLTARTPGEFYGQLFLTAGLKRGCSPILGDAGGRVFGAALRAMPTPLALTMICLGANDLTLAGLAPALASIMFRQAWLASISQITPSSETRGSLHLRRQCRPPCKSCNSATRDVGTRAWPRSPPPCCPRTCNAFARWPAIETQ